MVVANDALDEVETVEDALAAEEFDPARAVRWCMSVLYAEAGAVVDVSVVVDVSSVIIAIVKRERG